VIYSVELLEWWLRLIIKKCQWACDYIHTYKLLVEEHEDEVVVPLLFKWMCDERKDFSPLETVTAVAVDTCASEIGQRIRSPTSEECVGRNIRRFLGVAIVKDGSTERQMTAAEVVYWGEIGTQMYFNPPFSVKAATGKLLGFQ
jgi:hypothetical protein